MIKKRRKSISKISTSNSDESEGRNRNISFKKKGSFSIEDKKDSSELESLLINIECDTVKQKIRRMKQLCQNFEIEKGKCKSEFLQKVSENENAMLILNGALQKINVKRTVYRQQQQELEQKYKEMQAEQNSFDDIKQKITELRVLKKQLDEKMKDAANCCSEIHNLKLQLSDTEAKLVAQTEVHQKELNKCHINYSEYMNKLNEVLRSKFTDLKYMNLHDSSFPLVNWLVFTHEKSTFVSKETAVALQEQLFHANNLLSESVAYLFSDIQDIKLSLDELSSSSIVKIEMAKEFALNKERQNFTEKRSYENSKKDKSENSLNKTCDVFDSLKCQISLEDKKISNLKQEIKNKQQFIKELEKTKNFISSEQLLLLRQAALIIQNKLGVLF